MEDAPKPAPQSGPIKRWTLRLLALGIGVFALANLALWLLSLYMDTQLPDIASFDDYRRLTPQVSRVLAADGTVVGEFYEQRRTVVSTGDLPRHLKLAAVAAEDGDFYAHEGLDWFGMARAMWVNIRDGRFSQGGSTITQQLARGLHLGQEKTLWRKFRELFLARKLDRALTKDEILVLYLNQIYFGRGRYGIEEAARLYLGKHARQLSVAESALLMAVVPSPERLNPFANYARCLARRDRILDRMVRYGFIDAAAGQAAKRSRPALASAHRASIPDGAGARWYVDAVRRRLEASVGRDRMRRGGLRIYTPLERNLQQRLDTALVQAKLPEGAEGAAAFVRLATREVVALSGSRDPRRGHFNRALQARRQAGSTFKPFVYGAGLESGRFDAATRLSNARLVLPGAAGAWRPKNAGGRYESTPVTLADALARSLNVVAVRALHHVGIGAVVDFARRAGLTAPMSPDLTLALGNVAVSPLELANAYATLGSGGIAGEPVIVRRVESPDGDVVYAESPRMRRALGRSACDQLARWLVDAVEEGTGRNGRVVGIPVAGKTGTSNRGVDAWFVGFTPDVAGAVWVGRDDAQPMAKASGGRLAAPVFSAALSPEEPKAPEAARVDATMPR